MEINAWDVDLQKRKFMGIARLPCVGNWGNEHLQLSPSGKTGCGESL